MVIRDGDEAWRDEWNEAKKVLETSDLADDLLFPDLRRKLRDVFYLPEQATWKDIMWAIIRRDSCLKYGLSEKATDEELDNARRRECALEMGMSLDSSWDTLSDETQRRIAVQARPGLPLDASWDAIEVYDEDAMYAEMAEELGEPIPETQEQKDALWAMNEQIGNNMAKDILGVRDTKNQS